MRILLLPMALLVCGIASAQDPAFDKQIADIRILTDKRVQKEIKLSQTQLAHLKKYSENLNAELAKLDKSFAAEVKKNKSAKPPSDKAKAVLTRFNGSCLSELSSAQVKRLRELTLQSAGIIAIFDPRVAAKLGLSSTQISSLKDRFEANSKRASKIQSDAAAPVVKKYGNTKPKDKAEAQKRQQEVGEAMKKVSPKLMALENEFRAMWDKTLTAGQKAIFKNLLGASFNPK